MRTVKGISAKETLEVLSKPYATVKDIEKVAMVGTYKARQIRLEIIAEIESEGYRIPNSGIPMDRLVKYLNININYLIKMAKLEK